MHVFIAGANGQIGQHLLQEMANSNHEARALVRHPEKGPEKLQHYLRAKRNADEHLKNSGLNYTIVRPGRLTNDDGTGKVAVSERLASFAEIPRQDVARVLLAVLDSDNTDNRVFDVVSGDTPVVDAVAKL
ncbi:MAG: NAD(P)H-binding protein [Marinobacter sp.]|nr:NAD(P)H-binding protein [Marinobacter sp.]